MFRLITCCLLFTVFIACKPEKTKTQAKAKSNNTTSNPQSSTKKDFGPFNTAGLIWMDMAELENLDTLGNKKLLIDIYTSWCSWCKIMDKKSFGDKKIQAFLRENFHIAKFDAESKTPIIFNGIEYNWRDHGKKGINDLTLELLGNKLSYPALVYLDKDKKVLRVSQGYQNPEQLLQELEVISKS